MFIMFFVLFVVQGFSPLTLKRKRKRDICHGKGTFDTEKGHLPRNGLLISPGYNVTTDDLNRLNGHLVPNSTS